MNDPADIPADDAVRDYGVDRPPGPEPGLPLPQFAPDDKVEQAENWRLVCPIGRGGFGEVWLARHEWKKELRAVKYCTHPDVCHRLIEHEKRVLVHLMRNAGEHPHIVPLLEYSLKAATPWLMYEYVEGGTLAGAVAGWGPLSPEDRCDRAVRTLHALAGALDHCHRLAPPIVHRDLKPGNILMAGDTPRVTDFGIGGVAAAPVGESGAAANHSADIPTLLKTARSRVYSAPEREHGSKPHPRDDVYALGVLAYQLWLGDLTAVPGTDAADTLRERAAPDALISLVVRSVAMDPARRPNDASEWAERLAPLLSEAAAARRAEALAAAEADYQRGRERDGGRSPSYALAREWYEKAAAQGHAGAQYALGQFCRLGRGVPQDYTQAREWFELAAAQGHADAQYALGFQYDLGQGVVKNVVTAREWYEKAAAQGHADAQYTLGELHAEGRGVPSDLRTAWQWFHKAAAQGHRGAKKSIENLKRRGRI